MNRILFVTALGALLGHAEECGRDLLKLAPRDVQGEDLNCPTVAVVGVQPARIVCAGQTTTTTLVWTYTDCEPTQCVPLPDGHPLSLGDHIDLGAGSKQGPPGLGDAPEARGAASAPGWRPSGQGDFPPGSQPSGILPNTARPTAQPLPPGVSSKPGSSQSYPPPFNSCFPLPSGDSAGEVPPNITNTTGMASLPPGILSSAAPPFPKSGDPAAVFSTDPNGSADIFLGSGSETLVNPTDVPIPSADPTNDTIPPVDPTSDGPAPDVNPTSDSLTSDANPTSAPTPSDPTSDSLLPPEPRSSPAVTSGPAPDAPSTTSDPDPGIQSTSETPAASSSTASPPPPDPACPDIPNGDFSSGQLSPWYISDQVTADSSAVVPADGNEDHPHAFALIPSQADRAQVYLNNKIPSCQNPPPQVTVQISFDYQWESASNGCSIAVALNRSPDDILLITDEGAQIGTWLSYRGDPTTVQLNYDYLFTVKLMCDADTANTPAILITDIKVYP